MFRTGSVNTYINDGLQGNWLAEGLDSGTKFSGIELDEGEWFDYDEKANEEVSITEIKWEVRRC